MMYYDDDSDKEKYIHLYGLGNYKFEDTYCDIYFRTKDLLQELQLHVIDCKLKGKVPCLDVWVTQTYNYLNGYLYHIRDSIYYSRKNRPKDIASFHDYIDAVKNEARFIVHGLNNWNELT